MNKLSNDRLLENLNQVYASGSCLADVTYAFGESAWTKRPTKNQIALELEARRMIWGVSDEVAKIGWLNGEDLVALGKNGIKSLDDLADLASDELLEIVGIQNLNEESAGQVIMAARAHWFVGARVV
jgi:transcription termination factor NusA